MCVPANFAYEVRVRNSAPTAISSNDIYVNLVANNGTLTTGCNLMLTGGLQWTSAYLGTNNSGPVNGFVLPLNDNNWRIVRLQYQNNVFSIFIDGIQTGPTFNYAGTICNISALNTSFKGRGQIDWAQVLDQNGNQLWREDFLNCAAFTPYPACASVGLTASYLAPTCENLTLQLNAATNLPAAFSWSGSSGYTSVQQNPAILNMPDQFTGTYTVTATPTDACFSAQTVTVPVSYALNCRCEDSCSWGKYGNMLVKSNHFIGSINGADFKIRTNNIQRLIVAGNTGNLGINLPLSTLPTAKLHIDNNGAFNSRFQNLPARTTTSAVYIDADGYISYGRRSIFGRETDNADADIEAVINNLSEQVATLTQRLDNCACGNGGLYMKNQPLEIPYNNNLLQVSPNPFNGSFIIEYTLAQKPNTATSIKLISSTGVVVKTVALDNTKTKGSVTINEPTLIKGSYIATLYINGKAAASKTLIKN